MERKIAKRALQVERSLFYVIREMALKYKDSIYLSVGEPDFPTPRHIVEAGKRALDQGYTHYSGDKGYLELRRVIAEKLAEERGINVDPNDGVVVTCGGGEANLAAILSTVNPGDEAIIPSPYYPPYYTDVILAGGVPKFMKLREELDFMPDPGEVEELISPRTKLMIVNSPNNPTGAVFSKECLESLAKIAKKYDLVVLSDEVYEKLVYNGAKHYSISTFPGMRERTIVTGSLSKTYAMTGWRVGYAAGDPKFISQMLKIHYAMTISAPSISQRAALAALTGPQEPVKEMLKAYDKRRKIFVEGLNEIPGIRCNMPKGAFYLFPNIKGLSIPSLDFAKYLVKEERVAVVPGKAFGPDGEGHLRISYPISVETIQEALRRIRRAIERLNAP